MPKRAAMAINVAEAKRRLADLLGRVAYAGESILITRRGRPMARLVPVTPADDRSHPGKTEGWLEDDDPYFQIIEGIVGDRARHRPRALARRVTRRRGR